MSFDVLPPETACKHGKLDCDRCGSSRRRDALHGTTQGRGHVGQLRKKKAAPKKGGRRP